MEWQSVVLRISLMSSRALLSCAASYAVMHRTTRSRDTTLAAPPHALLAAFLAQLNRTREEDGSSGPGLVVEVIKLFIGNANGIINDIAGLLNEPVPDFDKVDDLVHRVKGCSCSVGAKKVNLSCMHFNQYIEARSKEGCLMALALLRNEFCDVCNKFQTMMQLEQQIAAYGPK
ncbi:histidine-containing phosphotransfer protein 2-like [Hordeum vulgare subsp. vulgare]|uniref:histidine-containing phosphotransfer protein 2-like n=1 Tax=Hordeum vulgare subsp. vulgare TaxID=112509 RepID=UPI001D1A42CA|nr:histidine-containing phosphotransfer protein 2-like [Hordeum vulgare subsp. vulgare]